MPEMSEIEKRKVNPLVNATWPLPPASDHPFGLRISANSLLQLSLN